MSPRLKINLALVFLFLLGLGIRMYDLTDPPLDFHPTRQLLGALISRGMYYQMLPEADPVEKALALDHLSSIEEYEPPLLNRLVAITYLGLGGEHLWVARIYSALFWLLGGLALYALAARSVSPRSALVSLSFYLFLPFAVYTSRSFQVDPLMVMFILFSAYALYRWSESPTWGWTAAAGLLSGLAILVKVTAAFPVIAMAAAAVLANQGLRRAVRQPKTYAAAALVALPAALYYLINLGERASGYFGFWTLSLWRLVLEPSYYVRWMSFIHHFLDLSLVFICLAGVFIAPLRLRPLLLGLWAGYALYGTFFPFQIRTHDYYHLMLVPIMALSAAPLAELVLARLAQQSRLWQALFLAAAVAAIAYPVWVARSSLLASDYRHEPGVWQAIGEAIPTDGDVIALTHDYGYRLGYYGWRRIPRLWPTGADLEVATLRGGSDPGREAFLSRTEDVRYFLVTLTGELEAQGWLKDILYNEYAIHSEGDGFIIFDLYKPKAESE